VVGMVPWSPGCGTEGGIGGKDPIQRIPGEKKGFAYVGKNSFLGMAGLVPEGNGGVWGGIVLKGMPSWGQSRGGKKTASQGVGTRIRDFGGEGGWNTSV